MDSEYRYGSYDGQSGYSFNPNFLRSPLNIEDSINTIKWCKQKIEEANKTYPDDVKIGALKEIKSILIDNRNALNKNGPTDNFLNTIIDCSQAIEDVRLSIKKIENSLCKDEKHYIDLHKEITEEIKFYENRMSIVMQLQSNESKLTQLTTIRNSILKDQNNMKYILNKLKGSWFGDRQVSDIISWLPVEINVEIPRMVKFLNQSIVETRALLKPERLLLLKQEAATNPLEVMTIHAISSDGQKQEFYIPKENIPLSSILANSMKWMGAINQIDTKEYPNEVVKEFFDFLALGFPPQFTRENVLGLIDIANRFDAPALIHLGLNFIKANGDPEVNPRLLQMGNDMQRGEFFNCCEEIIDEYIASTSSRICNWDLDSEEKVNSLRNLISKLLIQGMENNQKRFIWLAMQCGMKRPDIFTNPNELIEILEKKSRSKNPIKQMEMEVTISLCKQLIGELSKLAALQPFFKNELGLIELQKIPKDFPSLLNLSNLMPLTLNIRRKGDEKEYIDFVDKLSSQKINVNITNT